MTTKLVCMRGLPGSGKSTIARGLPGVVVGRDYLRHQMFGKYRLDNDGEAAVTVAQQAMVRALLGAGTNVVIDDMNVNPRYLRDWAKVARDVGVEFEVYNVPTSVETCIRRDVEQNRLDVDKSVGEAVIRKIANRFPIEKWPDVVIKPKPTVELVPYVPDTRKPPAIVVDIDGTLAHMDGRSPYDYTQVHTDVLDETINRLVTREWAEGTIVILCSGRDASCRKQTVKWLADQGVAFDHLYMRPDESRDENNNKLPDWIVKYGLFDEHIRDNFNVRYVLDDRQQVVDMWRALGLTCLQVAEGNF